MSNYRIANHPANRPYVISIAGFDPTAGAGLLSDLKCFEAHQVYGFGVCTALTIQTDTEFFKTDWLDKAQIIAQLQPLLEKFPVKAVKIGLIQNLETLSAVCEYLSSFDSQIKIVLDPILKASAGYNFHSWDSGSDLFKSVLKQLYLITPNYLEMQQLSHNISATIGNEDWASEKQHNPFSENNEGSTETAIELPINAQQVALLCQNWSEDCAVLLKGGHHPFHTGTDFLFHKKEQFAFKSGSQFVSQKHGSGCVLSSAITSQLALGNSLSKSCVLAKAYIENFLNSNTSLLGYHNL